MIKQINLNAFLFLLFAIIMCIPSGSSITHIDEVSIAVVQPPIRAPIKVQTSELDCLAKNIYYEARGEDEIGKIAVGLVTLNRVNSPDFPKSVCRVVNQQTGLADGRTLCQFSWVCDLTNISAPVGVAWKHSKEIAKMLLSRDHEHAELVQDATFFHATSVRPSWKKTRREVVTIGNHVFYK